MRIKLANCFLSVIMVFFVTIDGFAHHPSGGGGAVGLGTGNSRNILTLDQGSLLYDGSFSYWSFKPLGSDISTTVITLNSVASTTHSLYYGILDNLTLSVTGSWQALRLRLIDSSSSEEWQTYSGFTDASTYLTWRMISLKNGFSAGLLAGVELPTGTQDSNIDGNLASAGSGTFDPLIGASARQQFARTTIAGSTRYRRAYTNDSGWNLGDFVESSLLATYSLEKDQCCDSDTCTTSDTLCTKEGTSVYVNVGIKHEWLESLEKNDLSIANTGYSRLFGTAGLGIGVNEKLSFLISVDLPFYELNNGLQNRTSIRGQVGLAYFLKP